MRLAGRDPEALEGALPTLSALQRVVEAGDIGQAEDDDAVGQLDDLVAPRPADHALFAVSSRPHLRQRSGRCSNVSSGSSISSRDAPLCPCCPPCLRSERLRGGRLGVSGGSLDGGSEPFWEFWPTRRSSFSRRCACAASCSPCSATRSNSASTCASANAPPARATLTASSRRNSTLHNYAEATIIPARDLRPERVRSQSLMGRCAFEEMAALWSIGHELTDIRRWRNDTLGVACDPAVTISAHRGGRTLALHQTHA